MSDLPILLRFEPSGGRRDAVGFKGQSHRRPMILSAASRLRDRQTVWVARKNNDESFNRLSTDYGVPATVWAAQFAEIHADDVKAHC